MADKSKLKDMLQDLISDRREQAEMNSHEFIVAKMRELSTGANTTPDESEIDVLDPAD
jgi:hypothetical protein